MYRSLLCWIYIINFNFPHILTITIFYSRLWIVFVHRAYLNVIIHFHNFSMHLHNDVLFQQLLGLLWYCFRINYNIILHYLNWFVAFLLIWNAKIKKNRSINWYPKPPFRYCQNETEISEFAESSYPKI
jgi:hypothetical protein